MSFWSSYDDRVLRKGVRERLMSNDLAKTLGRSQGDVLRRAKLLGLVWHSRRGQTTHKNYQPKNKLVLGKDRNGNQHAHVVIEQEPYAKPDEEVEKSVAVAFSGTGILLADHLPGQCRWPFNVESAAHPRCCGLPIQRNLPYCVEHHKISLRKQRASNVPSTKPSAIIFKSRFT